MALILSIDTATEVASVCIAADGISLAYSENFQQREHASFVHAAIQRLVDETGVGLEEIDAFAVTSGPGSYTGLRVGMAAAKGFCFAFSKPMIAVNTLKVMAKAALDTLVNVDVHTLLSPMIDARRMEVFTALYDTGLGNILAPAPLILEEDLFRSFLKVQKVLFFGSGSKKFMGITRYSNACFEQVQHSAKHLACLGEIDFQQKNFADVSYSEPDYFKDFYGK